MKRPPCSRAKTSGRTRYKRNVVVPASVEDLASAPYNPRKINDAALAGLTASLEEFGDIAGITFNIRSGRLVTGHQRLRALKQQYGDTLKLRHRGARVWLAAGDERYDVRLVDWDEALEKAANIAANSPLLTGAFTDGVVDLVAELRACVPELAEALRFDDLLRLLRLDLQELVQDEVPECPENPVTKPGEVWILGDHRLVCGDATDPDTVRSVLGETSPLMMVTDPPYGVEYDPAWRTRSGLNRGGRKGLVANDDEADWTEAFQLFGGDIAYVWHAGRFASVVQDSLTRSSLLVRAQIIWRKPGFAISRGHYHWQHEPLWYAVRKGRSASWSGDRSQSTIWEISNTLAGPEGATDHGTQKPLECMGRPMRNHGRRGDEVYDPFLGSGTTLIAAEQLERRCLGVELAPGYCDVVVERWENLTGGKAVRS